MRCSRISFVHTKISFIGIGSKANSVVGRLIDLSVEKKEFFRYGLINDDPRASYHNNDEVLSFPGQVKDEEHTLFVEKQLEDEKERFLLFFLFFLAFLISHGSAR